MSFEILAGRQCIGALHLQQHADDSTHRMPCVWGCRCSHLCCYLDSSKSWGLLRRRSNHRSWHCRPLHEDCWDSVLLRGAARPPVSRLLHDIAAHHPQSLQTTHIAVVPLYFTEQLEGLTTLLRQILREVIEGVCHDRRVKWQGLPLRIEVLRNDVREGR